MSGGGGGGCPMWVLTYADMITVLMGFFVIMSTLNKPEKKERVTFELVEQFGTPDSLQKLIHATQQRQTDKFKSKEKPKGREGFHSKVTAIREGDRLTIGGPTYFAARSADLRDDTKRQLSEIASVLRGKTHIVAVKAYRPRYDIDPTSPFRSPTGLASARAEAVGNYLIKDGGLREELMRIEICAPVEGSNLIIDGTGLSASDRVDVVVLEASAFDYEPVPVTAKP